MTDRDKIKKAFKELRKNDYVCRSNYMCCMGCGYAQIAQDYPKTKKAVFYHKQDGEHIRGGNIDKYGLHLAWDGNGYEICYHLMKQGLNVDWDGDTNKRIQVLHSPDKIVEKSS